MHISKETIIFQNKFPEKSSGSMVLQRDVYNTIILHNLKKFGH